jgi:hypothetical protein
MLKPLGSGDTHGSQHLHRIAPAQRDFDPVTHLTAIGSHEGRERVDANGFRG